MLEAGGLCVFVPRGPEVVGRCEVFDFGGAHCLVVPCHLRALVISHFLTQLKHVSTMFLYPSRHMHGKVSLSTPAMPIGGGDI